VANWRKQLGGMDPLKPVILNNSSCACLAFAFQSSIDLIVDLCLSHVQCRLFCKCASVQRPNHCTEVSASIFTSPSSKNDTGICYLGPVWHGSNSGWSYSTPELQVEPVLVGVGALGGASSRWSRSCKRGAPKLHLHLHYSSMELAAPWSFGVGVFGWKIGWSCWSSAPEPCQTPPKPFSIMN